jgi:hypothetical protein
MTSASARAARRSASRLFINPSSCSMEQHSQVDGAPEAIIRNGVRVFWSVRFMRACPLRLQETTHGVCPRGIAVGPPTCHY